MSKLDTLKKQNPGLDISFIDALGLLFEPKYVEMILNIHKSETSYGEETGIYKDIIYSTVGVSKEKINILSPYELRECYKHLESIPGDHLRSIVKFIELNDRGLVDNKDVTSYKNIDEVHKQVSIAELKSIDKELEKLIIKVYENQEWLVVKPLTHESSKKYGAGTKWCTASENEDYQFHNYTNRGNLIYTMNKKTGYKAAAFKNLDRDHSRELSFWNAADERLDSIELEIPNWLLDIIGNDLRNCKQSNYSLSPANIKEAKDSRYQLKSDPRDQLINDIHRMGGIGEEPALSITTTDDEIAYGMRSTIIVEPELPIKTFSSNEYPDTTN